VRALMRVYTESGAHHDRQFGPDGQPPLYKCLEKYQIRPREDIRKLFAELLKACGTCCTRFGMVCDCK
jgi:hypothetical protein